jgi:putative endonuclease
MDDMTDRRRRTGAEGETLARRALERAGYRILARNYRCRYGELDIVAEEGGVVTFVEVKTRRDGSYGIPALAVTRAKRNRMTRAALHYLSTNHLHDRLARFDLVSVIASSEGWRVEILRNAFSVDEGDLRRRPALR